MSQEDYLTKILSMTKDDANSVNAVNDTDHDGALLSVAFGRREKKKNLFFAQNQT